MPTGPQPSAPVAPARKKPLLKRWWFWVLAILALFVVIGIAGGGGDDSTTDAAEAEAASAEAPNSADADETAAQDAVEAENAVAEEAVAEEAEEPAAEAAASFGLGDAVPTGDWEITVSSVETGVSELGGEFLNTTPQGQFILVDIAVKNTGSDASLFFDSDVTLLDDEGNTYSADSGASLYTAEDSDLEFLEEINPGNTATGLIVFDVPDDASPNVLEFQGGIFDTPAEVALD